MKRIILIALAFVLFGCEESKTNGSNKLNQEECECRGGEYTKTGSSAAMSGAVAVPVDFYHCFKDNEELYRVVRDETCESYWEVKNEIRYKWDKRNNDSPS